MSRHYLIHLLHDTDGAGAADGFVARWCEVGSDAPGRSGLPSGVAAGDRCTVLLGSEHCLLLAAPALPGTRRQRELATAFAVEDQLVAPVETQQAALSDDVAGLAPQLAVADRTLLDSLRDYLGQHGIEADRLLPDAALLDARARPRLLIDGERVVLRLDVGSALAGNRHELQQWLQLPACIDALRSGLDVLHAGDGWPADLPQPSNMTLIDVGDPLRYFSAQLALATPPNLLQGDYRPRRRSDAVRKRWQLAAMLLMGAGLLSMLYALLDYRALSQRINAQQIAMENEYRRLQPDATRIFDPVNQLRSQLSLNSRDDGDALSLLARVAPSFAAANVLPLFALEYREQQLDVTLRATDVGTLDAVRQRIAAIPGLSAELTAITPGQGATEGRLRIRSGVGESQ